MKRPDTDELKRFIGSSLEVSAIKDFIDPDGVGDKRIFVLKYNFEEPVVASGSFWARIIVMDQVRLFSADDHEDGSVHHNVYIRTDVIEPKDQSVEFNGDTFLQRLQNAIFDQIQLKNYPLERAKMIMPLYRVERPNMTLRSDRGFLYNGSTYKTVLASYE